MTDQTRIDERGATPVKAAQLARELQSAAMGSLPPQLRNPKLDELKRQQQQGGQALQL